VVTLCTTRFNIPKFYVLTTQCNKRKKNDFNTKCLQRKHLAFVSVSGQRLSRKSNNVVVFPFAFHIAVQQPFRPLWSRLLLLDYEPSRALFALCFMSLLMSLLPASGEFLFGFPSPRHVSSSGSYPFDLSDLGDPTGSNATAVLALTSPSTTARWRYQCSDVCTPMVFNHQWQPSLIKCNKHLSQQWTIVTLRGGGGI
jgi:hypothetical protein